MILQWHLWVHFFGAGRPILMTFLLRFNFFFPPSGCARQSSLGSSSAVAQVTAICGSLWCSSVSIGSGVCDSVPVKLRLRLCFYSTQECILPDAANDGDSVAFVVMGVFPSCVWLCPSVSVSSGVCNSESEKQGWNYVCFCEKMSVLLDEARDGVSVVFAEIGVTSDGMSWETIWLAEVFGVLMLLRFLLVTVMMMGSQKISWLVFTGLEIDKGFFGLDSMALRPQSSSDSSADLPGDFLQDDCISAVIDDCISAAVDDSELSGKTYSSILSFGPSLCTEKTLALKITNKMFWEY